MEVPDAFSRMRTQVAQSRKAVAVIAKSLKPRGPMSDFEIDPALWRELEETADSTTTDGVRAQMSEGFHSHVLEAYKDNRTVLQLIAGLEANQGVPKHATGTSFILAESRGKGIDGRLLYFLDPKDGRKWLVI